MTAQTESTDRAPAANSLHDAVWSGLALLLGSIMLLAAMLHHPEARGSVDTLDFLRKVDGFSGLNRLVHGTALACLMLITFGFFGFVRLAIPAGAAGRASAMLFGVGSFGAGCAGLLNGFLTSALGERYAGGTLEEAEQLRPVLVASRELGGVVELLGVFGWSGALLVVGACLVRTHRWLAGLALLCSVPVLIVFATGLLATDVRGYTLFAVAQVVWFAAAGIYLLRSRKELRAQ